MFLSLGERIAIIRTANGLSQQQLADKVGCHQTYINKIEMGIKVPSATVVSLLCKALHITPNDIIDIEEGKENGSET